MTSQAVLIAGIKIPVTNYSSIEDFEAYLASRYSLTSTPPSLNSPKLMIVHKEYDSIELKDHPLYLVWEVHNLEEGFLTPTKVQELLNFFQINGSRLNTPQKYVELLSHLNVNYNDLKFGVYVEYYDVDRKYTLFE